MEKVDDIRIKEKVNFFYTEKCKVHVKRFDKTFWRGIIVGKQSDDVFDFIDDKLGKCYLFVKDIFDIEIYREVKE